MRYLLALAVAVYTCVIGLPAQADDESETQPAGKLMLVLDSSGSMSELTGDGTTRIDAAKNALRAVVNQLPEEQPVGMRVFGATQPTSAGPETYCVDSQNVAEVGTGNRDALQTAIDNYEPYGETPIGYALSEAGKDLGAEGQRSIVLVSDGLATCDPDPCVVASELRAGGVDVRIDVVGLNVDPAARDALECVAEAGGGTYYDATDTQSLIDGLTTAQTRSARPFDLTGEPIEGAADIDDAPTMEAPGQYLDTVLLNGKAHYSIPRTVAGSTIHIGVTVEGNSGSVGEQILMDLTPPDDPDGYPCAHGDVYDIGLGQAAPYYSGGFTSWNSDPDDPCSTSDELILGLEANTDELAGKPIEIAVYEEPPLADGASRDLPKAPADPEWETLEVAAEPVDDVVPGTSLASAPLVSDDTYALDITPGETQVFAVPLDWGQNVQAQFDATLTEASIDTAVPGSGITVEIVGPLRTEDGLSFYANEPDDWTTTALGNMQPGPFRTGAQSAEIAYLQRTDGASGQAGASLPGLRYVRVAFESREGTVPQPYTLTIQTNGKAGEGAPDYDTAKLNAPKADSPLVTSPVVNLADDAAGSDSDGDGLPVLAIGLGAAGILALLAAGALVAWSRRRGVSEGP